MKTIWIKAALIIAIMASTGAVTLLAGRSNFEHNRQEVALQKKPRKNEKKIENPDFYRWLSKELRMPKFVDGKTTDNRVELHLIIAPEGKAEIIDIQGKNQLLIEYVTDKVKHLKYPQCFEGNSYHFAIKFQLIPS